MKQIDGKREELSGRLQKRYGHTKEVAEKHIDDFLKSVKSKTGSVNTK